MDTFTSESKYERKVGTGGANFTRILEAYALAIENNFREAFVSITSTNWWQLIKKETD
jgi:hypothetical protein